jgi:TetR/AcrR family transcriptional regulator
MPTPRKQAEDVRARTLRVATRLLAERGFEGTSLQDVADAVGVRKPSLLYHFPSKAALREAVLEQMLVHWNVTLPRVLRAATSGSDQFDGVLAEMVGFFADDPDRAKLLLREVLDRPRAMARVIKVHMRPWIASVAGYIRTGQQRGELQADVDPEAYVVHVTTFLIATVAVQRLLGALPAERAVRELVRMARASLFLPAPTKPHRSRR